jgi:hypothetical protein
MFVYANIENEGVREDLKKRWPNWKPPKYAPQAMMHELNARGEEGWELVHMEPVAEVGTNAVVYFTGTQNLYGNAYFCVFKRRKMD